MILLLDARAREGAPSHRKFLIQRFFFRHMRPPAPLRDGKKMQSFDCGIRVAIANYDGLAKLRLQHPEPMQPVRIRVVHLSSGHHSDSSRIFWKECRTLARAGYDVRFVVPGGRSVRREDIDIVAVKRRSGRLGRILATPMEVVVAGLRQRGLIYHFHDPELIPAGLLLRVLGKRVIYDAHEDLPRDVLIKEWIPRGSRRLASLAASAMEWIAGRTLSGVVAATPAIARRFPKRRVALVQNFAFKSEFAAGEEVHRRERRAVACVGGVTAERCAVEVVEAIGRVRCPDVSLLIAGIADPPSLIEDLAALPGWARVDYRGLQNRDGIRRLLAESLVGLVLYHPVQAYIESQPIKLFEYMAAGLPVIAADFPGFREIVEGNHCGLCVSPRDAAAIAAAIDWIFDHPAEAEEMGRRGRELVMRSFNWEREEQALLDFYERIVGTRDRWRELAH